MLWEDTGFNFGGISYLKVEFIEKVQALPMVAKVGLWFIDLSDVCNVS